MNKIQLTVCNVILHSGPGVNFELPGIHRSPQSTVILPSVFAIGISLRVVNMLSRKVAAESVLGDFKLASSITVCHKTQNHDNVDDRLKIGFLERANVYSLTVVSKPVSTGRVSASKSRKEGSFTNRHA